MPSTHLGTPPRQPNPNSLQRDASNFDFRLVTLLLVLVTRADMLKEYLDDGKEKDDRNVPLALWNPEKWKTLRTLFDPAMLAEMLYIWECPRTKASAEDMLQVFHTMSSREGYEIPQQCPEFSVLKAIVDYSRQLTTPLNQAGVA
jgi:hypothetical protein